MTRPLSSKWLAAIFALACLLCAQPRTAAAQRLPQPARQTSTQIEESAPNVAAENASGDSLAGYRAALARCASEIAALEREPGGIAAFLHSLPDAWTVDTQGKTFSVSTAWLRTALETLQKKPADAELWRQIRERLEFLDRQASGLESQAVEPQTGKARAQLKEIFAQREFKGLAGPGALALWWRRVTGWVGEKIEAFLERLHIGQKTGNVFAYAVIGLALVLLTLWLYRLLASRSRTLTLEAEAPEPAMDMRAWLGEASAAAERGEYREAIHCAYWAAVERLETLGALPKDRSRTPRELERLGETKLATGATFRGLSRRFERVWYGTRAASAEDWASTKTELEEMGCLQLSSAKTENS
jgi:hypothetical protein